MQKQAFSVDSPHSAKERWICIYPVYVNNRRTRAQGRKLSIDQCIENPKHTEVAQILGKLSFDHIVETMIHPRERDSFDLTNKWRIRVHLKNDDGTPVNEQYPDRKSLLLCIGKYMPVIRSRKSGNTSGSGGSEQNTVPRKGKKKRK